jgi:hypothetical protein
MTDLVDIGFDLDRYLADGGKMYDIDFVNHARVLEWARTVTAEVASQRVERWGRYTHAMMKRLTAKSAPLSEDELQQIWKESDLHA